MKIDPARSAGLFMLLLLAAPAGRTEDYSSFIAAEADSVAKATSSPAGFKQELSRRLGIADLLARRAPPEVRASSASVRDGYAESMLSARGPAGPMRVLLLRPAEGKGPFPAVLGLGDARGDAAGMRDHYFGRDLAKKGYVVLLPDRGGRPDAASEFDDAFNLLLLGRTLTGLRVLEAVAWIDHMASDPSVDPARIGIIGHGAGSITGALAAALDERVKAVAVDLAPRSGVYFDFAPEILVPGFYAWAAPGALEHALAGRARLVAPFRYPDGAAVLEWFDGRLKNRAAAPDAAARPMLDDWLDRAFAAHKTLPSGATAELVPAEDSIDARIRADEAAVRKDPKNSEKLARLGRNYLTLGDAEAARRNIELAVKWATDYHQKMEIYKLLMEAQMKLGRLEDAVATCLTLQRLDPNSSGTNAILGDLYLKLLRYAESESAFLASAKSRPLDSLLGLARVHAALGRWEEARKDYRRALALDPSASSWEGLAWLDMIGGRFDAARDGYLKAVEADPRSINARLGLAFSYQRLKDGEAAREQFREARRLGFAAHPEKQKLEEELRGFFKTRLDDER